MQPRSPSDAAAVQGTHQVKGRGIGLRGFEHAMRTDVETRMIQDLEPLGFIAPADRAFAGEVAQFVEARVARDAQQQPPAFRQGGAPMLQHLHGIRGPMEQTRGGDGFHLGLRAKGFAELPDGVRRGDLADGQHRRRSIRGLDGDTLREQGIREKTGAGTKLGHLRAAMERREGRQGFGKTTLGRGVLFVAARSFVETHQAVGLPRKSVSAWPASSTTCAPTMAWVTPSGFKSLSSAPT